ncbi:DUF4223 family protein [Carnimonas nigrificans]|uniref:DUF4223 family protein n=1 Tax=Carnimonas nigrificans TaxID=64323 RepID=UPI00046F4690|nr:DUF4223 family protein [Carnimonas nigrificans]
MKKGLLAVCGLVVLSASLTGCTGTVKGSNPGCTYNYAFVPALSVSRWLNQCGPVQHSGNHQALGTLRD